LSEGITKERKGNKETKKERKKEGRKRKAEERTKKPNGAGIGGLHHKKKKKKEKERWSRKDCPVVWFVDLGSTDLICTKFSATVAVAQLSWTAGLFFSHSLFSCWCCFFVLRLDRDCINSSR